jgi:SAM-dependent methyltransferase
MDDQQHWQRVYERKASDQVSWFQPSASRSLELIRRATSDIDSAPVIDVGGGASVLVDELLDAGYRDLTVLDLAGSALATAQARLGARAAQVRWIEGDVRSASLPSRQFALWHDRAVFHFLVDAADRAAYMRQVRHALRPGGHALVATFALDGPTSCSGLPVARYDADSLHRELGPDFSLVASEREEHHTPMGTTQAFVYCLFRWDGSDA